MSKFSLNYDQLEKTLYKKAYRLSDVKDQLETVAFDVVRFKDNDEAANLWKIEAGEDGDYIIALYPTAEETGMVEKTSSDWNAVVNKTAGYLNILYKGEVLTKLAHTQLNMSVDELSGFAQGLPKKLSESKSLVKSLLKDLPKKRQQEVLEKYPEIK